MRDRLVLEAKGGREHDPTRNLAPHRRKPGGKIERRKGGREPSRSQVQRLGVGQERCRRESGHGNNDVMTRWQIESCSPAAQWLEAKKKIVVVSWEFSPKDFPVGAGRWANCGVARVGEWPG